MPKRWWGLLAGALLLLLAILVFPFQSTIVKPWQMHVVDDYGLPVPRINVTEHWQHYLLESEGHEEKLVTDERGVVAFPERTIRANLAVRITTAIVSYARHGAKVRSDPYASIVVWGSRDYQTAVATSQPGTALPAYVITRRQR